MNATPQKSFQVPDYLNASVPAEYRGLTRDSVNLMVIDSASGQSYHRRFDEIGKFLMPGDLLVLNKSRTIPAVIIGEQDGKKVEVRLSHAHSGNQWEALIASNDFDQQKEISFPDGVNAKVIGTGSEMPLVILAFSVGGAELFNFFYLHGNPIRYEYIHTDWPLDAYQTVYASAPGSVEMASAGRAFTWRLLQELRQKGVKLGFIQLHAGLSYYGNDQWPNPSNHPEAFEIPEQTASHINEAKRNGHRVIAVGTTVVRTLESAATEKGMVKAAKGITNMYITKDTELQIADGLLTGFHEPEASHMDMLTAFLQEGTLLKSYQEAIDHGYLWHEFGDMNLILPMGGVLA
ncbi:S-adenosylmethionine:tRNA ribosyltransferase-isomerase [Falsibacillus albus]|uniref:S-adenosylmethionine:tRNA ribosyltransferase-isomerase n=2 Tax=Falsibacillus albus TaxID=2478915 RepID=A0A3L7JSV8_9BACI|nr:S-adenosylmethionine:tRNA ribosyltransferase-isomerase [Falsibacillus albus]